VFCLGESGFFLNPELTKDIGSIGRTREKGANIGEAMKFESILFHTRLREAAFESLQSVLTLKPAGLRRIVLVYVIRREEVAFVPYAGFDKREAERQRSQAEERFARWAEVVARSGIDCRWRVELGETNPILIDIAEKEAVDLIVTGRKSRTGFDRVYVGSHILDMVRRSPVPLLMAKYAAPYTLEDGQVATRINDRPFVRPLLATDWSAPSRRGLEAVIAMGPAVEKALVAHVMGRNVTRNADAAAIEALENESRKRLDDARGRLTEAGISAEAIFGTGHAAAEIVRLARSHDASTIVMGRTGKDWFEEYWLGGVSHRVAETSERPVLVIP
jgi:nucleotide-binding universal stress UspA family protein